MVDVPSANLALSSVAPEVSYGINISIPSANLVLTTEVAEVNGFHIQIPSANLVLSTFVAAPTSIIIPSANLVLSASLVTLGFTASAAIEVPSGNLRLSVSAPQLKITVRWVSPEENPGLLCPRNIGVRLSNETASPPGRSLGGKKQFVQADAGFWIITLDRIRIRSNADINEWRRLEGALNGRANTALIFIPSEDNTIVATANAAAASGTTTVFINRSVGNDVEEGMHFSVAGRLYRVREVVAEVANVFEVRVRPPVREAIANGASLNFSAPECRVRLMRDDGMNITHELLKFSTPTVVFCEDWMS